MHHFHYKKNELYCEDVPISSIAEKVGTPFYVYSHATLKQHFDAFDGAFSDVRHLTCYSMKSNSNKALLALFARRGGGVDIVSGGELYRALNAGVDPAKIVFSGVGKSLRDLEYAMSSEILMFNVESPQELMKLNQVALNSGKKARISIRVNPDVDPQTHPYISTGLKENKFGIGVEEALQQYERAAALDGLDVVGVSCHIGSQLTQTSPFVDALGKLKALIAQLERMNISIRYLDLGGGLGISYDNETPPSPSEYACDIKSGLASSDWTLILEPGRVIVGNAGVLITKVLYAKTSHEKNFFVVDAAMNDLMRPSLYGAYHGIQSVKQTPGEKLTADIVGPICESGDFLAKDRLVDPLAPDDLIAVMSAGAYGFSMSSTYNSRPRVCEVMVKGGRFEIIRQRETFEDLVRGESIPDFLNED
ncbi:MAG: diaminopimelate decarboxylase [Deltaproteobacteria bacterium]|nr:diaminopimelate decarboxylase [Deltaproteobacteria bacterium]